MGNSTKGDLYTYIHSRTSSEEVWTTANEESTAGEEEEDDSIPELVSGSEDSGYEFLNTPTNQGKEFNDTTAEEEPNEVTNRKVKSDRNNDIDEEKELEDSIEFILNMEDPNYKEPEPCIGLTCPLTGEQYYVD